MRYGLLLTILLWPTFLIAQTVFYAPSAYTCAPQGERCVCTQNESSYFPKTYTLQNDCDGKKPFKMKFSFIGLINGDSSSSTLLPHEIPNYPNAQYVIPCGYPGGCQVGIRGNTTAIKGPSSNWKWGESGYECDYTHVGDSHNPKDCPLIAQ